jgi:hypothetical protein
VVYGWKFKLPSLTWTSAADISQVFSSENLLAMGGSSGLLILLAGVILSATLGKRVIAFLGGACVVFALAWLAQTMAANVQVKALGLEYVVFALGLGLLWSHLLPTPSWLMSAVRTEFFIKIGIVILGANILFPELMKAGLPGLIQAALVIPVIWHMTFRLARWLKVDDEFGDDDWWFQVWGPEKLAEEGVGRADDWIIRGKDAAPKTKSKQKNT